MADFSALKTSIQNYIKQNGNEEITGNLLQQILLSMVSTLGDSAINDLVVALNAEIANRGNADTTLQGNINSEAAARGNADTELGGRITTLQGVVNGIVANVENGYVYAGIATPSATPVSGKVFYLALTAGTYTNFGAIVVPQGINILKYNGSAWSLDSFLGLDDAPIAESDNLVKSGGIFDWFKNFPSVINISYEIHKGGYFQVNTSSNKPIFVTNNYFYYASFDVKEHEVYKISGAGGNSARLWAVTDINDNIILKEATNIRVNENDAVEVLIPSGGVKLYYNSDAGDTTAASYDRTIKKINVINKLDSENDKLPLSALMGKTINDKFDNLSLEAKTLLTQTRVITNSSIPDIYVNISISRNKLIRVRVDSNTALQDYIVRVNMYTGSYYARMIDNYVVNSGWVYVNTPSDIVSITLFSPNVVSGTVEFTLTIEQPSVVNVLQDIGYKYGGFIEPTSRPVDDEFLKYIYIALKKGVYTYFKDDDNNALNLPLDGMYIIYKIDGSYEYITIFNNETLHIFPRFINEYYNNELDGFIKELYIPSYDEESDGHLYLTYVYKSGELKQAAFKYVKNGVISRALYFYNSLSFDISGEIQGYGIFNWDILPDGFSYTPDSSTIEKMRQYCKYANSNAFDIEYSPIIGNWLNDNENVPEHYNAMDKDWILSLSCGLSSEDEVNGTSKYDIIRENAADKELINSACSVLYNLQKMSYNKQTMFTKYNLYNNDNTNIYAHKDAQDNWIPFELGDISLSSQASTLSGKNPLVYSLDLFHLVGTWPLNDNSADSKAARKAAFITIVRQNFYQFGAIPLLSWHIENPYCPSNYSGNGAYRYIDSNHRNVIHEILNNTGSTCGFGNSSGVDNETTYSKPKEWYDAMISEVVELLSECTDENGAPIPMVFRLFHECEDSWAWWGADYTTKDDYISFFRYSVSKFIETMGTHNVLWCYCTDRYWDNVSDIFPNGYLYRYPGDDYCDIMAYDDYSIGTTTNIKDCLLRAKLIGIISEKHHKVCALYETDFKTSSGTTDAEKERFYPNLWKVLYDSHSRLAFANKWSMDSFAPTEVTEEQFVQLMKRKNMINYESGLNLCEIEEQ